MEEILEEDSRAHDIADALLVVPYRLGGILSGISIAIIYVFLAEWSYLFIFSPMKSSAFWLPSGVTAFLLIYFREYKKLWPYLLGGIFFGEVYVVSQHSIGPLTAVLWGTTNIILGLSLACGSRRFFPKDFNFHRVKDVLTFVWIVPFCVLPGSLLAAFGTIIHSPESNYFFNFITWALSDALGIYIVAPVLFAWSSRKKIYGDKKEALLLSALLVTFSLIVFFHPGEKAIDRSFFSFLTFFAGWAAIRFGARGVTLALIVIDLVEVWATVRGFGTFSNLDLEPHDRLLTLQLFVTNLGILMLVLAVALEEQMDLRFRAESATRIRDDFISVASHELKTPLQSLKMEIQILNNYIIRGQIKTVSDEKLLKLARISEIEIRRFGGLINDLLDVSKISSGRVELNPEEVELMELVSAAVERQKADLEKSGSIIAVTGKKNVLGHWDRARIEQVITNLIANAIKYGNGRPILINVNEENSRAIFTIKDHGVGIKAEDRIRIFGRFERAVPKSEYSGMGLGLFIASQIVEAHHGRISVESIPGITTTFTVELPLALKHDEIHPNWKKAHETYGHIYH